MRNLQNKFSATKISSSRGREQFCHLHTGAAEKGPLDFLTRPGTRGLEHTQEELNLLAWSYLHDCGLEVAFAQTRSASTAPLEVWVRNSGRGHAGCPIEPGNEGGWHYAMLSPRQPQS